jgi:hypothetical protein
MARGRCRDEHRTVSIAERSGRYTLRARGEVVAVGLTWAAAKAQAVAAGFP